MGLIGWMGRRFLAAWLFAPLFGFWYVVFEFGLHLPPRAIGTSGATLNTAVVAALVAAFITDGMIVRRVKRIMKRREAENRPPQGR